MDRRTTTRRRFLGLSSIALAAGLAGCSSGNSEANRTGTTTADPITTRPTTTAATETPTATPEIAGPKRGDELPPDPNPDDGYPPSFETEPEAQSVDPTSFATTNFEGVDVPLVPVDVAYYWYVRGEARFVDARSETGYEAAHVFGAVSSPAPAGQESGDPVAAWPKSDRAVCYCACPHHLSSMRAAHLLDHGYEEVYAIDEGFTAWRNRNYPVVGDDVDAVPSVETVTGATAAAYAGETAWATEPDSGQMEATAIGSDGGYALDLKFVDVDADTEIQVRTPAYTVRRPLGVLTAGRISADGVVEPGR